MPSRPAHAALVALALSACSAAPIAAGVPRVVEHALIAPYAMRAECVRLAVGDRVDWRYESNVPLHFDVSYREGNAVMAPVVRDESQNGSGTFEARLAQDYCFTWEAGPPGAIISYRVLLR